MRLELHRFIQNRTFYVDLHTKKSLLYIMNCYAHYVCSTVQRKIIRDDTGYSLVVL